MLRTPEKLTNGGLFNCLTRIHNSYTVGDSGDHSQVVTHIEDTSIDTMF
jgi:hypothetical protein